MPTRPAAFALAMLVILAPEAGAAGGRHEHGVMRMDVAVDGPIVTIDVEMPLEALVGFERPPRTDTERRLAETALARVRSGGALFRFDAAADCTLQDVDVRAPLLATGAAEQPDGHGDLNASYRFRCAEPGRLRTLELLVFDTFRRIERAEAQAALPSGQRRVVLRPGARVLRLTP